jgi:hypothetical protein
MTPLRHGKIAEAEDVIRNFLATDVEAIWRRHAKRLMLRKSMRSMPRLWEEQRQRVARSDHGRDPILLSIVGRLVLFLLKQ